MSRAIALFTLCAALGACRDSRPDRSLTVTLLPPVAPPSPPASTPPDSAPGVAPVGVSRPEPAIDLTPAPAPDVADVDPPIPPDAGPPDAGPPDAADATPVDLAPPCVPSAEACNGIDDDCDAVIDEDFDVGARCVRGQGQCAAEGDVICAPDGGTACTADPGPAAAERCDGLDNDCDGAIDEAGDARTGNACGGCGPAPEERCNGADDDCDGLVDEGFEVGGACTLGIPDICAAPGALACDAAGARYCAGDAPDTRACARVERGRVGLGTVVTCAIRDAAVVCWGGEPSVTGDRRREPLPAERDALDLGMQVVRVVAATQRACALGDLGAVKCWGRVDLGALGVPGNPNDVVHPNDGKIDPLPFAAPIVDLDAGGSTCAVDVAGGVRCWGRNSSGQLGYGHYEPVGDEPGEIEALPPVDLGMFAVQVAVGSGHACALSDQGRVKCWGANSRGQLGLGHRFARIGVEGQMGDALRFVDLGMSVVELSATRGHTCALGREGQVKCWGAADTGAVVGRADLGVRPDQMGDALPVIPLPEPAISVSASERLNCAVGESGRAWCWGTDPLTRAIQRVTPLDLGEPLLRVEAHRDHLCAVTGRDRLKCWGRGFSGQLGYGDNDDRPADPDLPDVMVDGI